MELGLFMRDFLIHPTELASWYALINEASTYKNLHLSLEIESYLVYLLMKFYDKPDLAGEVIGLEFLKSLQSIQFKPYQLKEVGDKCLIHAGLFPEQTKKRRVNTDYYIKLGKTAYLTLAEVTETNDQILFNTLCDRFIPMMEILNATRDIASHIEPFEGDNRLNPSSETH